MPLWRSMKMTSVPRELLLPYRRLTHLAQTVLLLHRSPLWGARLCDRTPRTILQCVLWTILSICQCLYDRSWWRWVLVTALQERVAHVLASQKDKRCADLSLPSYATKVQNVPTCLGQYGFCGERKCQLFTSPSHTKVCKMEELGESVVWREAVELVAIKTFLEAHRDVFDFRLKSTTHSTDQNQRSAASSLSSITKSGVWRRMWTSTFESQVWSVYPSWKFYPGSGSPSGSVPPSAMAHSKKNSKFIPQKKSTPLHV